MIIDNPIRMVRELRGAPLTVLFALTIVKQRVSQLWLERTTGYTDKTISQALGYLQEINLVDHTGAGWQLTGQARQLPMPLQLEEENSTPDSSPSNDGEGQEENSDTSCRGRRISDSENAIIIINTDLDSKINNNNNIAPESRKNSDSGAENDDLREELAFEALEKVGIMGVKRRSLAGLRHVTAEWVEAWDEQLREEKGSEYKPGLLVRVLESGGEPQRMRAARLASEYYQRYAKDFCPKCARYGCDGNCEEEET